MTAFALRPPSGLIMLEPPGAHEQALQALRAAWSKAESPSGPSRSRHPRPRLVAIDRDPRAVLASRKVVWPAWGHVLSGSVDRLPRPAPAPATPGQTEPQPPPAALTPALWAAWLAEAIAETEASPFDVATQRGHPYTQSARSLCIEMLASRRYAEAQRDGNGGGDGGGDGGGGGGGDDDDDDDTPSMLLLSYEADVLRRPRETAERTATLT